jgi:hypothetical protein
MITLGADVDRCERCFKTRGDGEHGVGLCPLEPRSRATAIITDDIPGGVTYENYGPHPRTFYSHTERRRFMAEHGLTQKEKFCPTPGTDRDPAGVQDSRKYIDPYTMANAVELLSRCAPRSPDAVDLGKVLRGEFNISAEKDAVQVAEGGDVARQSRIGRRLKADVERRWGAKDAVDTGR